MKKKIKGNNERLRLSIHRSLKYIGAQLIDDVTGKTLVSASALEKGIKKEVEKLGRIESANLIGKKLAEKALKSKITKAVLDRKAYRYHGRVKALVEGLREGGVNL